MNAELEMIGEYALCTEDLKSISLPASLKHLGKGSLHGVRCIDAYEDTAKGLIGAVNATLPTEKQALSNVFWNSFKVTCDRHDGCTDLV